MGSDGHARPGVADLARRAGVSTATVDRVLNRRGGVRAALAERVLEAATELAYLPAAQLGSLRGPVPLPVTFLLPGAGSRFMAMLAEMVGCVQHAWQPYRVRGRAVAVEGLSPELLARTMRQHGRRGSALVVMAPDHPRVRDAIQALAQDGVPVLTLITDLPGSGRLAYVGLDNHGAGRTAGYLLGRFLGRRRGQVALLAASRSYAAHQEREQGFAQVMAEQFPGLQVLGLREGQDDPARTYRHTLQLLDRHRDLVGLYNVGGASEGVARALAQRQRTPVFIGHGLTPDTRALLIEHRMDAVITQSPQGVLMSCVRILANWRDHQPLMGGVELPRSQVIFRENLP